MQTVQADLIAGKKVILRYDLDVPIENGKITDDFRLKAGLPTLKLCLENAEQVIILGHVGRPNGQDPRFSVAPIYDWFLDKGYKADLESDKLKLLENLRFEAGEDGCSLDYSRQLAAFGDVFVNEAFAAWHPAASTTILPTLLPHAAGLRFASEVRALTEVRNNPKKPLVVIIGGVKVEDKLPVIKFLAERSDAVLVGGKLIAEIRVQGLELGHNVLVGHLTADGLDVAPETISAWTPLIKQAKMVVWNGPLGQIQNSKFKIQNLGTEKGTYAVARILLESPAELIVGGGDTVGFLQNVGLLDQLEDLGFVSSGGGAMLELLVKGSLPTIEALE